MPWRPGSQRRASLVLACCKDGLEAGDRASDRLRWMKQKGALLSIRHFTDVLFLQLPWEVGSLPRPRGRTQESEGAQGHPASARTQVQSASSAHP